MRFQKGAPFADSWSKKPRIPIWLVWYVAAAVSPRVPRSELMREKTFDAYALRIDELPAGALGRAAAVRLRSALGVVPVSCPSARKACAVFASLRSCHSRWGAA